MSDTSSKTVTVNFIWRMLERFGAQGISFIVSIVLARLIDPTVYGTVALVTVFTTILQVFVDSGLGNALIQKKVIDDLDYSSVFYFNVLFGLILYFIMFFSAPFISNFYGDEQLTPVIRVLSLMVVISSIKNIQHAYVARNMLFKRFFWSTLWGTIIAGITGICMAKFGYGVWALVAVTLVNMVIDTAILWITVGWRPKLVFSYDRLKVLLSFGWKILFARLVETTYTECRSMIIWKLYTSEDLAYFNRGKQYPTLLVTNVDYSLTSVLFPVMSSMQDDINRCKSIVKRTITLNMYIVAPMMMGLAICGDPLVKILLTEKWLPCVPYLRIFCFSLAFLTFNTANMNSYRSLGRSDIYLKVELARKVFGIIILIATMYFGVLWIALGEIVVTIVSMVITAHPNKRLLNYGFFEQIKDVTPSLFLTIVMGAVIYPISKLNISSGWILILQIIIGIIIYVIGSLLLKLETFDYLRSKIKLPVLKHK